MLVVTCVLPLIIMLPTTSTHEHHQHQQYKYVLMLAGSCHCQLPLCHVSHMSAISIMILCLHVFLHGFWIMTPFVCRHLCRHTCRHVCRHICRHVCRHVCRHFSVHVRAHVLTRPTTKLRKLIAKHTFPEPLQKCSPMPFSQHDETFYCTLHNTFRQTQ